MRESWIVTVGRRSVWECVFPGTDVRLHMAAVIPAILHSRRASWQLLDRCVCSSVWAAVCEEQCVRSSVPLVSGQLCVFSSVCTFRLKHFLDPAKNQLDSVSCNQKPGERSPLEKDRRSKSKPTRVSRCFKGCCRRTVEEPRVDFLSSWKRWSYLIFYKNIILSGESSKI